jgi:hypothetical protein
MLSARTRIMRALCSMLLVFFWHHARPMRGACVRRQYNINACAYTMRAVSVQIGRIRTRICNIGAQYRMCINLLVLYICTLILYYVLPCVYGCITLIDAYIATDLLLPCINMVLA